MRPTMLALTALGAALAVMSHAASADTSLGRDIAANCAACHGTNGVSQAAIPGLAGLQKTYIIEQMQAFKAGQRQATVMHQIAKGYSDEQIAAVAEFLSQQAK